MKRRWPLRSRKYRCTVSGLLAAILLSMLSLAAATSHHAPKITAAVLGMPSGPWPLFRQGPKGVETYLIPSQLDEIRRLPEPDRSNILHTVEKRQSNLSFLQQTIPPFFSRLQAGNFQAEPEYAMDLSEIVMAVDSANAQDQNPLFEHEPLLLALPPYTRAVLFVPEAAIPKVKERLKALALSKRVRIVASQQKSSINFGNGATRWVRDIMLVTHQHGVPLMMPSLAYENYSDIARNDLGYLGQAAGKGHHYLRMPIFFQGGNLAVAKSGRKVLFAGAAERTTNQQWFLDSFGFEPSPDAVHGILKAVTGADEVLILPNSSNLFHLDMFMAPLADGIIGLLAPVDPEQLAAADRLVLNRTAEILRRAGFHVVPIPTSAERIGKFEAPTNIVSFIDRRSGRRRALVPQFPESAASGAAAGLNAKTLAAYRNAGIDPVPVEDRFYQLHGSVHCALVALH
jgi:hypothetical protein